MTKLRILPLLLMALTLGIVLPGNSEEGNVELQKRLDFINAYNGKRADKRLAALSLLNNVKEEKSIETLFFVSWADCDPEIRSRAFSSMVHCEDTYGFVAYLAAESFKQEQEIGVKVEKAIELGGLKYKWSALNELVHFTSTLRWSIWNWPYAGYHRSGGYIASGDPPPVPDYPEDKNASNGVNEGNTGKEPRRWQSENELIGLVLNSINRLSGTRMESRARIDQEIVKWWDRKSELWEEYDRKLRARTLANMREVHFMDFKEMHFEDIKPGKDTLREALGAKTAPVSTQDQQKAYLFVKDED